MILKFKKRKKLELKRKELVLALPSFINQLILFLNSGMVLSEAMASISSNYERTGRNKVNVFAKEYCEVFIEAVNTGRNMVVVFNEYCKKSHVKELSRIGGILIDGDKRGIDLLEKLREESRVLWEQRKQIVLENIRLADSKMSFPLALLLIALIIVSAAPAMMQMYI